jgi:hypothetical protein
VSPASEWAAANKSWRRQVLFQRRKNLLIFESKLKAEWGQRDVDEKRI